MFLLDARRWICDLYAPEIAIFDVADGEQVVLGGGDAMQTELEVGAGVGELGFDEPDGREVFDEAFGELIVAGHFLFGEMEGLGEETVASGIERGALFALGSFGAGGALRVQAVGKNASVRSGLAVRREGLRFDGVHRLRAPEREVDSGNPLQHAESAHHGVGAVSC